MTSPTTFPVRLPSWWRPLWWMLHLLVALTVTFWVASLWARDAWLPLGFAPMAVLAWLLAMRWRPLGAGNLRWDGQCWQLGESLPHGMRESEGSLSLAIDAGGWMLLRFRRLSAQASADATVWLLLGHDGSAHGWAALRRAVYSPRPDPAGPSAQATAPPNA